MYPLVQTVQTKASVGVEKEAAMNPQTARQQEPSQPATAPKKATQLKTVPVEPSQPRKASGPSGQPESAPPTTSTVKQGEIAENRWQDLEEGLETLERLRKKKLISEEEFQSKRKVLLDSVKP
jgi:hypothetical protein